MSAKRVVDSDGDTWEQAADGDWVCSAGPSWLPSLEIVERLFGPLTEVTES